MLNSCSIRLFSSQFCISTSRFSTGSPTLRSFKLYLIAGEASGDAIGAKVIRALQRQQPPKQCLEFRGIGGPQMCQAGGFESLFPINDLSIMGFVEVLPHIWRLRQRLDATLRDIQAFKPELVLTIDSKGFNFRVLKALQAREAKHGGKRIRKVHYVSPSVWAYKHRRKRDFTDLKQLLDALFTILPFEEDIFHAGEINQSLQRSDVENANQPWCHFVGHPTVEDFLEANGVFESSQSCLLTSENYFPEKKIATGADALLDLTKHDTAQLLRRTWLFQNMILNGRNENVRDQMREKLGIPADAFVICALVGSRENEVKKSTPLVLNAIKQFKQKKDSQHEQQSSNAAVAVSGTIVLETTLAGLPTVVIYRANWLTEWIAQWLAAVRFISVPNLLLGRMLIPELLFSKCSASKIAETLRSFQKYPLKQRDVFELAMTASTLTNWLEPDKVSATSNCLKPIRASDLCAKHVLNLLAKK
ncbi:hypothetical protein PsorP6_005218 [Peronosclerospora sorghi]|uniref:Uncharacterized protein n=1 Tax=Peronosclerospora sorghi TaxID=230839 RepID=A0ACC0W0Z6_9STRA|nr:hypothetical protein PsorP6_005218 [Peronosclerospora sorghi]